MQLTLSQITIRPIQPNDNVELATIVRAALKEFGANKPGTVYYDPTTDALFELFQKGGAAYFVAESSTTILGGGGIYPSDGLPHGTGELVKMYLRPEARGIGLGKLLIRKSLQAAQQMGYTQVYIESMPELAQALHTYEKFGFRYLDGPLGNTGHFGCDRWMLRPLSPDEIL